MHILCEILISKAWGDRMKCQECPNKVRFILVNGSERSALCDICFADTLFDLVTSNEKITIVLIEPIERNGNKEKVEVYFILEDT